jgi:phenylpropionate dioxygenase-like ring-hydroxylating dioxygenase large terminal subunit
MATRLDIRAHDDLRAGWRPQPTLSGAEYTSAEVFERERARLFHGRWFAAARADAIGEPRAYAVVDVAGESVIVLRDEGGAVRAFFNVCRHRGSRLCDGAGRLQGAIRCPYHAWAYTLDGRLAATPNVPAGEQLPRADLGLVPVPVEVWQGFVWVNVSGTAPPLAEQFRRFASDDPEQWARYGLGELVTGARREYDVAANWKVIVENYNECLHCPTVHPSLVPVVPLYRYGEVEDAPGAGAAGNRLADGLTSFSPTGRSALPTLPGLSEHDANTFYGVTLLPNLIVNYHSDNVSTFHLFPVAPGRTRVVCDYLFRPETVRSAGFDPSEVVDFRHRLALEDWAVCERAQEGAGSQAFAGGGVLPYADRYLHAFHEQYRAMRDADA